MKELSIEEKAKAYDESIERAKVFKEHLLEVNEKDYADEIDYIFPELKENRDEKVKKSINRLIRYYHDVNFPTPEGFSRKDLLDWIEKQGEQKPIDKIKPKFTVGDKIKTKNGESFIITRFDRWGYWSEDSFICNFDDTDNWELVEQKPAEWSEEDESLRLRTIGTLVFKNQVPQGNPEQPETINSKWLKEQCTLFWKPSDEQMNTLEHYMNTLVCNEHKKILFGLYADLKKLKG